MTLVIKNNNNQNAAIVKVHTKLLLMNVLDTKTNKNVYNQRLIDIHVHPSLLIRLQQYHIDTIQKKGEGVVLAVRKEIQCHEVFAQDFDKNECVAIQIFTKNGPLLICSLYIPPQVKISSRLFDHLTSINLNCLVMGDLNAASVLLGSRKTNHKGLQLQELLNNTDFSCIDDRIAAYERKQYAEKFDTEALLYSIQNGVSISSINPLSFFIPSHIYMSES